MKRCALVFPVEIGLIWLATKKLKVGAGLLNGYGGKFDREKGDVTLEDTARRELVEESGAELKPDDTFELYGIFDFYEAGKHIFECYVYLARSQSWRGRLKSTPEMSEANPYDFWGLPHERMMPADRLFVKRLLDGEKLRGKFYYSAGNKEVLGYDLHPLEEPQTESQAA